MKEIIIRIPEKRFNFFMELMNQLGFEISQKYDIPEAHINIVKDRINKEDPIILEWDKARANLNLDS